MNLEYKVRNISAFEKRVILSSSLDFCVTYHKIYIYIYLDRDCSGHASVVLAAPVYNSKLNEAKWARERKGLIGLLSLNFDSCYYYFVIFCRSKFRENSLFIEMQKVTFKLVPFIPILFSYTVAPFIFETNYLC